IGAQHLGAGVGVGYRGDAGARHHLGDERDALAPLLHRYVVRKQRLEALAGAFLDAPAWAAGRIAVIMTAGWISRALADARAGERELVDVGGVTAAMLDVNRMRGGCAVEIANRQPAALSSLGVVVFEAEHPGARRRARGALAQRGNDGLDGSQIAVDRTQMAETGLGGMRVSIDEPRHDCLFAEVDFGSA